MQQINTDLTVNPVRKKMGWKQLCHRIVDQKYLFLMSVPLVIWLIVFAYIPLLGWVMAFQNFKPGKPFLAQQWVGLQNFLVFLQDKNFFLALRNTLAMSVLGLVSSFTVPVALALLLNEIRNVKFKRTIQTVSYLPHFVSWVIVAGMFAKMLSTDGGVVNELLVMLGILDKPVQYMAQPSLFWGIVTLADMWKEMGWNTIIFLAAMTGIDQELYEAAITDGAGRFRRMWHITLPGIRSTYIVLLIMAIGWLTSIGFEKQMLLGNSLVQDYSLVLDLYVLKYGLQIGRFSFGTAVGMMNSLVAILLLFAANRLARKMGEGSLI